MNDAAADASPIQTEKSSRRKARAAVLRMLYARELRGESGGFTPEDEATLHDLLEIPRGGDGDYVRRVVRAIEKIAPELDELIAPLLRGWAMDRLNRIDRLILRLAVYEILREPPADAEDSRAVAIASALDLARVYSTEESLTFINGVLASVKP